MLLGNAYMCFLILSHVHLQSMYVSVCILNCVLEGLVCVPLNICLYDVSVGAHVSAREEVWPQHVCGELAHVCIYIPV